MNLKSTEIRVGTISTNMYSVTERNAHSELKSHLCYRLVILRVANFNTNQSTERHLEKLESSRARSDSRETDLQ